MLLIVAFSIAANVTPVPDETVSRAVAAPLRQDATLIADAQRLGIDYKPLSWHHSSVELATAVDVTAETADDIIIGLFLPPNTIIIATNLSDDTELNIVAYEYMHYIWAGLSPSQRQIMGTTLDQYRTQNPDFDADVARYHGDAATIQDEENSTACTRVQPYLLSDEFNNYCNRYIPNRTLLFP